MKHSDLDNAMDVMDAYEERERVATQRSDPHTRSLVGTVEHYFDKIDVAAIKLSATLKVGDIIEIGDEEDAVRQKISSMQINREDVQEAFEGDEIGIKLKHRVEAGSSVYKMR
ncbi:MAG: translation elongation factor-like protein [Candidatus Micrarchaeota archaeon]|nr:translation elongation factor-like protein [Candidatus Micrarchaeota archaeon]